MKVIISIEEAMISNASEEETVVSRCDVIDRFYAIQHDDNVRKLHLPLLHKTLHENLNKNFCIRHTTRRAHLVPNKTLSTLDVINNIISKPQNRFYASLCGMTLALFSFVYFRNPFFHTILTYYENPKLYSAQPGSFK